MISSTINQDGGPSSWWLRIGTFRCFILVVLHMQALAVSGLSVLLVVPLRHCTTSSVREHRELGSLQMEFPLDLKLHASP